MEAVLQVINTLGFPIACVIGCCYYIMKLNQQQLADKEIERKIAQEREDKLYTQIDKFSDSLTNFNNTLIRIDARLEAVEKKLDK